MCILPSVSVLLLIMVRSVTACSRILDMLRLLLLKLNRLKFIVVELIRASRPAVLTTRHQLLSVGRFRFRDVITLCALTQTTTEA